MRTQNYQKIEKEIFSKRALGNSNRENKRNNSKIYSETDTNIRDSPITKHIYFR